MRFLARLGGVVLKNRALLVPKTWGLDVRYCIARLRYVEDTAFILDGRFCVKENDRYVHSALFTKCLEV